MLAKRQASKQRSKQKKESKRCAYRVCMQAKKKSKQAAFYCVSVTRNVFFAYVMLYLKQVFMYAKHQASSKN